MAQHSTGQSLQRTVAAAGILALLLATAPVVPTLDADGDLTLASGTAHGKGKGKGVGNARKVVSGQIFVRKGGGDSSAFRVTRSDRRNKHRSARILDNGVFATGVFHGLPPGMGKRHDNLPYGLAKRGVGNLPKGLAKDRPIPPGLTNRTELPPGLSN